ncbi:MAG: histidine phosphatase family protein [Deltaproteobacteria bacterium]
MADTKTLFLVRHAKSSWDDANIEDIERPLNKRGKADAPRMGKHLAGYEARPEVIISSPAVRAYKTAREIAAELGFKKSEVKIDEDLYSFDSSDIIEVIRGFDDVYQTIMLVGHNPAITRLVNELSGSSIDNVPTCGVALLRFNVKKWSGIKKGTGELLNFDYPKKLW